MHSFCKVGKKKLYPYPPDLNEGGFDCGCNGSKHLCCYLSFVLKDVSGQKLPFFEIDLHTLIEAANVWGSNYDLKFFLI